MDRTRSTLGWQHFVLKKKEEKTKGQTKKKKHFTGAGKQQL